MTTEDIICRAIADRHILEFQYDGETCVVEPHQLGLDPNGLLVLSAYWTVGHSESEDGDHQWRVFRVSEVTLVLESSEPFAGPRPGYERAPNGVIRSAVCEL